MPRVEVNIVCFNLTARDCINRNFGHVPFPVPRTRKLVDCDSVFVGVDMAAYKKVIDARCFILYHNNLFVVYTLEEGSKAFDRVVSAK